MQTSKFFNPQRQSSVRRRNRSQPPENPKRTATKRVRHHHWTQEERETVKREYQGTLKSRRELAAVLEVSEFAVAGQIARMGLCNASDRTKWTPEEDKLLIELVPQLSMDKIAKQMNRSINAVTTRSKRLKTSRRTKGNWHTLKEVTDILGKDRRWVLRRIEDGRLKATPHYWTTPNDAGNSYWRINRNDLKVFIQTYPHELNGRNVDLITVVDILAGLKPIHPSKR